MTRNGIYHGHGNTTVQHKLLVGIAACAMCTPVVGADAGAGSSLEVQHDTIIINARRARQADDRQTFYLSGALSVRSRDWEIQAETAAITGDLEDPDRIEVEGDPARIRVLRDDSDAPLEGTSSHLEFDPRNETIRLDGDAVVLRDKQSISSDSIRYLLNRDTFSAGSGTRVKVVTTPKGN